MFSKSEIDNLLKLPGVYIEDKEYFSEACFLNFGHEHTYIDIFSDGTTYFSIDWNDATEEEFYKQIIEPLQLKAALDKLIEEES